MVLTGKEILLLNDWVSVRMWWMESPGLSTQKFKNSLLLSQWWILSGNKYGLIEEPYWYQDWHSWAVVQEHRCVWAHNAASSLSGLWNNRDGAFNFLKSWHFWTLTHAGLPEGPEGFQIRVRTLCFVWCFENQIIWYW